MSFTDVIFLDGRGPQTRTSRLPRDLPGVQGPALLPHRLGLSSYSSSIEMVTGESYGGVYVPSTAVKLIELIQVSMTCICGLGNDISGRHSAVPQLPRNRHC